MAEEVVRSKKLLVTALIMGMTAVALFYLYTYVQEKRRLGDEVRVLKWARDIDRGEEIIGADVVDVPIRKQLLERLEGVMQLDDRDSLIAPGTRVNRRVRKHDFVRFKDVLETLSGRPSENITHGMVAITLAVDPYHTPGDLLRVNDRVDVIGLVSVRGRPKAHTLIQNLRVLVIGGSSANPEAQGMGRRPMKSMRVYRAVTVEVYPDVAVQLADLMPRIQGKLFLTVRNPTDTRTQHDNKLNPEILPVLEQPLPEL